MSVLSKLMQKPARASGRHVANPGGFDRSGEHGVELTNLL